MSCTKLRSPLRDPYVGLICRAGKSDPRTFHARVGRPTIHCGPTSGKTQIRVNRREMLRARGPEFSGVRLDVGVASLAARLHRCSSRSTRVEHAPSPDPRRGSFLSTTGREIRQVHRRENEHVRTQTPPSASLDCVRSRALAGM